MFLRNNRLESLVGVDAQFDGNLVVKGTIKVDGRVVGNIDVDWLILGEKSFLQGNVNAGGVDVGGKIEGNITAREIVSIHSKGYIKGDIKTAKLTVDEGGIIDGMIAMSKDRSGEGEHKNDKFKVIELRNDKNVIDNRRNVNFKEIKFEEVKSH